MKNVIITIASMMIVMNSVAGLDSIKKKYESDMMRVNKRYLFNLKIELSRARSKNEIIEIESEISRIENIIDPLDGEYIIKYDTGVRTYKFDGESVMFLEGNTKSKFTRRSGKYIIINHASGSVETWEKTQDGTYSVVFDTGKAGKRFICGKAVKK